MSTQKRMPLYPAIMLRFNAIGTALMWPLFLWVAITRDWTVIFLPLLFTAGVTFQWLSLRREYGTPGQVGPQPDYAAIGRMEREVWGETFRHEGSAAAIRRQAETDWDAALMHYGRAR